MTTEEKAKAYDNAFNVALETYKTQPMYRDWLEKMFPELKESNDESIRKALINGFNKLDKSAVWYNGITNGQILTWLEKQMQKPQGKSALEAAKEEKVDNQNCVKPAKVEPKFKVSDWIVHYGTENIYQVVNVIDNQYQLKYGDTYTVQKCADVDRCARLWNIAKDAKCGDVLYLQHNGKEHIIIYKGVIKERFRTFVSAYCAYNGVVYAFCFADVSRYIDIAYGGIMPATNEQRDLLFQKMKEAGYEFDFEKKELKKVEQKFDIEIPFGANDSELQEWSYSIPEGFHAEIEGDKVVIKKGEQKPTDEEIKELLRTEYEKGRADVIAEMQKSWSEEDENRINRLIAYFEDKESFTAEDDVEYANWLKSIRLHSQWRPSEEMIEALGRLIPENVMEISEDEILLGKLYQGLKYGRVLSKK